MDNPFSHLEDEKLMELYQKGDHLAFNVIYDRYHKNIYTYLTKRVFDQAIIEDIFQTIILKFHKSRNLYNPKYELLKWIYTISRSVFLDELKKKKFKTIEFNEKYLEKEEVSETIEIELTSARLSQKEKEAIELRYFSDKEFIEIANLLETSDDNTRKIISRGLIKLRSKYLGR